MFWSAMEVYPKECMGCLCRHKNRIELAVPYQKAKRKKEEVESASSSFFEANLKSRFVGDYHSHPRLPKGEKPGLSETDIRDLSFGEMEGLVHIRKVVRPSRHEIKQNPSGTISIAWGRFRGLIAAFVRIKGPDGRKKLYYQQVRLKLED